MISYTIIEKYNLSLSRVLVKGYLSDDNSIFVQNYKSLTPWLKTFGLQSYLFCREL